MRIFIVGPVASGKSVIGKKLAKTLAVNFVDTDKEIEKNAGVDISWIFEEKKAYLLIQFFVLNLHVSISSRSFLN